MDTFMDKLAQKLTAQEMIKANAAADAAELSRMREQTAEYEKLFAEMQGSSEKNAENAQKVQELVEAAETDRYKAAAKEVTVAVNKAEQTINFFEYILNMPLDTQYYAVYSIV